MTTPKQTRRSVSPQLIDYMLGQPNQNIHAHTIARDLGIDPGRASTALGKLVDRQPQLGIVRVSRGVYAYQPTPAGKKEENHSLFELIGTAKDGAAILERDDGRLYRATEL